MPEFTRKEDREGGAVQPEAAAQPTAEVIQMQLEAPKLRAQIVISLYEDGNAQVNGPFEDRILFRGLLEIAADIERSMYQEKYDAAKQRVAAQAAALAKEPAWKRIIRQARERRAAVKQAEAQALANAEAARSQDELAKALDRNATTK